MSSEVKANKLSPATGTDVTLGDASDTFTLPASATIQVASSGEIDIASGATLDVNGTIDLTGATKTGFSDNTPSWNVTLSGDFSCTTGSYHKVQFDTEVWDTDSAYDSTTNYRFTVPVGEGGKYLVTGGVRWPTSTSKSYYLEFWKNGAAHDFGARRYYSTGAAPVFTNTAILDLDASDYCEMYVVQGSGGTVSLDASNAYFSGFKLAGV